MISSLIWAPAAGGGTQTIQFKADNTTTWLTFSTVGPTVNAAGVTGLNYNTLYDFRIVNNCPTGSTTNVVGQDIVIQCPNVLITPSDTVGNIQFFHLGGTIDSYKVDLLNASSGAVLQTQTLVAPFSATVTTSFSGLSPLTTYNVRVSPFSGSIGKTNCAVTSFQTANTPTCPAPVGLTVTFS